MLLGGASTRYVRSALALVIAVTCVASCGGDDDASAPSSSVASQAGAADAGASEGTDDQPESTAAPETSSEADAAGASERGEQLTIAFVGPPLAGLHPALSGGTNSLIFSTPAYDTLLWQDYDGTRLPMLATEWGYVGEGNTVFEIELRDGVQFSDGETLDAEAVKKSLEYHRDAGGVTSSQLVLMDDVEVVDDLTVRLHFSAPHPQVEDLLTQNYPVSMIVSPKALDDPESLNESTAGAGPYVLDPGETVTGDHYTYVANENYWNPDAVKYDTVVVRVIGDPNAMLAAVQSGQVDVGLGSTSTVEAAGDVEVVHAPSSAIQVMLLADRDGTMDAPLADQTVRQALDHAVDQDAIAAALIPAGMGAGVHRLRDPAAPDAEDPYPFDPELAAQMLADAGYPDGFTLHTTCAQALGHCPFTEAIASQFADVGVTLEISTQSSMEAFNETISTGQSPVYTMNSGYDADFLNLTRLTSPTVLNAFGTEDSEIADDLAAAAAAPPEEQAGLITGAADRLTDLAWFIPVWNRDTIIYAGDSVTGVAVTQEQPLWAPFSPDPDLAWAPA